MDSNKISKIYNLLGDIRDMLEELNIDDSLAIKLQQQIIEARFPKLVETET